MDKTQIPTGITVRDFIITDKQRTFVGVNVLVNFVKGLFVSRGVIDFSIFTPPEVVKRVLVMKSSYRVEKQERIPLIPALLFERFG